MKVEFLKARLEVTEKEWEKANKKWMNADDKDRVTAFDANMKVRSSMTKMAFLNGQRKILKELIVLENKTSNSKSMESK